jgi:hypothetical protein
LSAKIAAPIASASGFALKAPPGSEQPFNEVMFTEWPAVRFQ